MNISHHQIELHEDAQNLCAESFIFVAFLLQHIFELIDID